MSQAAATQTVPWSFPLVDFDNSLPPEEHAKLQFVPANKNNSVDGTECVKWFLSYTKCRRTAVFYRSLRCCCFNFIQSPRLLTGAEELVLDPAV